MGYPLNSLFRQLQQMNLRKSSLPSTRVWTHLTPEMSRLLSLTSVIIIIVIVIVIGAGG